tara:strand:- start:34 stop:564 length:531 start_codon:yes stop_codon:yes gene_type:complete
MKDKDLFISQVAAEYSNAKHEPKHPSYKAFCRETVSQFRGLVNSGWKFSRSENEPYDSSDNMFRDMANKKVKIFSGGKLTSDNPLNTYHLIVSPERKWWTANEMFRAVHDILGHYPNRSPYETFEDELAAYKEHKKWYSPEALPALYGETVGQLCVYYHTGDFVKVQENKIIEVRL